jgi:hypothetical protein
MTALSPALVMMLRFD